MDNDKYFAECAELGLEPLEEKGGILAWLDKLTDVLAKQDKVGPTAAVKAHLRASAGKVESELANLRKQYPVESERPADVKKLMARLEKTKASIGKIKT
jgi:hypothetical protein